MITVELETKRRLFLAPSPVNQNIKYPERTVSYRLAASHRLGSSSQLICRQIMHAESIDFGFMYDSVSMMRMSAALGTNHAGITFTLNLLRREIDIQFQLKIEDHRVHSISEQRAQGREHPKPKDLRRYNRHDYIRFRIPLAQLQVVHETSVTDQERVFLISLDAPPNFYRKTGRIEETHDDKANFWKDWDAWYRQTDVVYSPKDLRLAPLTLNKLRPIIDIGRCRRHFPERLLERVR